MSTKLTTKEFIDRAHAVHGYKYGYAFSVYKSAHEKVLIYCPKHGVFEQKTNKHLSGKGCHSCGKEVAANASRMTCDVFIKRAKETHSEKYKYLDIIYVNKRIKVSIICEKHGIFSQSPADHIGGSGCPRCAKHGFDRTRAGFLYVLRSECGRYMKIGITNNPDQRHAQLSRTTPFSFSCIEMVEGDGSYIAEIEKELLSHYQPVDFSETFDGSTEWRLWDKTIRSHIK